MLALRSAVSLLLAVGVLLAHAADSPHRLKERVPDPRDWVKREPAPAHEIITLKVGLHQAGFSELERRLYEISDPFHGHYGQHLSKAEVEALVAPHKDSLETVVEWLKDHGLEGDNVQLSAARDWVTVRLPVALAEAMLDTVCCCETHMTLTLTGVNRSFTSGNTPAATAP